MCYHKNIFLVSEKYLFNILAFLQLEFLIFIILMYHTKRGKIRNCLILLIILNLFYKQIEAIYCLQFQLRLQLHTSLHTVFAN